MGSVRGLFLWGQSGSLWVGLLWAVGDKNSAIGDSVTLGYVQFLDEEDGTCAGSHCIGLGETSKFIGKTLCPYCHVFALFDEVKVFICNVSVIIICRGSKGSDWSVLLQVVLWLWD